MHLQSGRGGVDEGKQDAVREWNQGGSIPERTVLAADRVSSDCSEGGVDNLTERGSSVPKATVHQQDQRTLAAIRSEASVGWTGDTSSVELTNRSRELLRKSARSIDIKIGPDQAPSAGLHKAGTCGNCVCTGVEIKEGIHEEKRQRLVQSECDWSPAERLRIWGVKKQLQETQLQALVQLLCPLHLRSLPIRNKSRAWPKTPVGSNYRHHFYRQVAHLLGG